MMGVAALGIVGTIVVGVIGFTMSYTTLRRFAETSLALHGVLAQLFPVGIDVSILSLLALDLYMVRARVRWPVLRLAAHGMTLATVWFNAAEGTSAAGAAGHGVMPALFVLGVEAARRRLVAWAELEDGTARDGVPLVRWLLSPWSAFPMYRRMRLRGITSYDRAVAMEKELIGYRVMLNEKYAAGGKPSAEERLPFTMQRYGYDVAQALALPAQYREQERRRQEETERVDREAAVRAEQEQAKARIASLRAEGSVTAAQHQVDAETGAAEALARAERARAEAAAEAAVREARSESEAVESAAAAEALRRAAEDRRAAAEASARAAEVERGAAEARAVAAEQEAREEAARRRLAEEKKVAAAALQGAAEAEYRAAEARRRVAEVNARAVELEDHARLSPKDRAARRVARMILAAGGPEAVTVRAIAEAEGVAEGTASERRTAALALLQSGYDPTSTPTT